MIDVSFPSLASADQLEITSSPPFSVEQLRSYFHNSDDGLTSPQIWQSLFSPTTFLRTSYLVSWGMRASDQDKQLWSAVLLLPLAKKAEILKSKKLFCIPQFRWKSFIAFLRCRQTFSSEWVNVCRPGRRIQRRIHFHSSVVTEPKLPDNFSWRERPKKKNNQGTVQI